MSALPDGVRRDHALARLTTIRTGGSAEFFARPGTVAELVAVLGWAGEEGIEVGVVGSGSNLLIADEGVRGLVLKLDRDLSHIEQDGSRLDCGGVRGSRPSLPTPPAPGSAGSSSGSTSPARSGGRCG
jgi:UDP-N-acetylenolpyruvoylglucosamine reductase